MALALALTDAQILGQLGDGVKKNVAGLPNYWSSMVARAHSWAVNRIVAALSARGYSLAQIQAADQISDYESNLTLFWAFKNGGIPEGYNDTNLKTLDLRDDLKEVCLTQAGAFINPAGPQGIASVGKMESSDDIFDWPPTDGTPPLPAEDLGEPTLW